MHIRKFQSSDRASVREIAADTADAGRPVENILPARELFADLMTRYYTDFEPGSTWVAEQEGRVIGYLNGCLHSRRHTWTMALRIVPASIPRVLGSARVVSFILRNLPLWMRSALHVGPKFPPPAGHLHINIRDGHRGLHAGGELMKAFFEQARAAGIQSIRVSTREDNDPARRFFERHGFVAVDRRPILYVANVIYARIYSKTF